MAERIVSPGVFTQENDLSFLPVGIGEIGAAIIGRTERGRAFEPVVVRSMADFELQFGSNTAGTYVPYTVKQYIKSAGSVTIVRVLGLDGYSLNNQVFLTASGSSTGPSGSTVNATTDGYLLGVIHASALLATQQETQITFGTPSGGTYASGAITLPEDTAGTGLFVQNNYELQIGDGGNNEYRFIAHGGTAPADGLNTYGPFYFLTGSSMAATAITLAAEITAHAGTFVTVNAISESIQFTSSLIGLAGNTYTVQSGSSAGVPTNCLTNGYGAEITTLGGGTAQVGVATALDSALTSTGTMQLQTFKGATSVTWSYDKTNSCYWPNQLMGSPGIHIPAASRTAANMEDAYMYSIFNSQSYGASANNTGGGYGFSKASASLGSVNFTAATATSTNTMTSGKEYTAGATPWVVSQTIGTSNSPLFKFHTLSHGNTSNVMCKVSILSIKAAGSITGIDYGSFTVVVRKFDDTDNKVVGLESYANLSLDPNSPNYIGRRIGDKYKSYDTNGKLIITGDYSNLSKYIRVEVHENVKNAVYSDQLVPFGHEAYLSPFVELQSAGDDGYGSYPQAALVTSRSISTNTTTYFGFNFNEAVLNNGMKNYLAPISDTGNVGFNSSFLLSECTDGNEGGEITVNSTLHKKRFSLGFQGGYDGVNPATPINVGLDLSSTNTFGLSFANTSADGYTAYKKALDTVTNPDEIDINLIVLPGVLSQNATNIVDKVITVCEDRGDCFYVFDGVNSLNGDNVAAANAQANLYDTNYAAMYYPWIKILDATVNKFVWVPPSVVIPGVYSYNDKVAFPWFAPAGLNRGSLGSVLDVYTRLTHSERDDLYEAKVNPIAVFPNTGVCVWGQKTLQTKPSALDRINVRRLLIKLKKFIASSTKYLVFENNTTATRNRFLNIVNPYLETVQQQQGLYAFKVIMDESNNGPEVVDRNQMVGEIFLQPAKAAEFIIIDFNIMRTGASFEE
jgi:hypothetical protein